MLRRLVICALAVAAPLTACAAASAATPATAPVRAAAHLYLPSVFVVGRNTVTVPGRRIEVQGTVRPYVPGQWVRVRAFLGRRAIRTERLRIKPVDGGQAGAFSARVQAAHPGIVRIVADHGRTAAMLGFEARRAVAVLAARAGFGSRGRFVQLIQQRLADLHVYVPRTGVYDQQTGLALDAYHRLLGWGTSQSLDGGTVSALLDGRGAFRVRYPRDGRHAEGNLGEQLLALIDGGRVYRIYPISSGKQSTPTITGHFRVYSKVPGYLPDGMYDSNFFYGGYAIHGYDPAPDYPASHGCMRLPIVDAPSVFAWLQIGNVVDVYP